MNGMILQTPTENKDIKQFSKKGLDTASKEDGNLFENLIEKLVLEEGESKNAKFLLGKLLNLQSDFTNKGKIISEFSKGDILKDTKGEEILLEDLFKLALMLKNNIPVENMDKLSKNLAVTLKDKNIMTEFKDAKNIKELLNVAKKHGIKVKNFEFFMQENTLNPKDQKMVQKITSEEIFKMIEPKTIQKELPSVQNLLSKIIKQEIEKKPTQQQQKTPTLTSLLKKEQNTEKVAQPIIENKIASSSNTKEVLKTESKIESKISQKTEPNIENTPVEGEVLDSIKHKKAKHQTLSALLKTETSSKETPALKVQQPLKDEPVIKSQDSESKEIPVEKSTPASDIKTETGTKTKEHHDVKKTLNTFATEFKEKVEAYKPPLMKIKMQLTPQNLGDVDVTMISRGNNLQVNINSNSNAMSLFVQNQAEFKNSLVNMGFSDLQMNFGDNRGQQQQQDQKKDQHASDYHDSLENEETEGIEMILPNYI